MQCWWRLCSSAGSTVWTGCRVHADQKGLHADAMPVEIVQFCWQYNLDRLQNLPELVGSEAKLRMAGDKPYVTDNSNYIVDLYFQEPIKDAKAAANAISKLTGDTD